MEFNRLKDHVGHKIVCASYGKQNVSVECEDCQEVLFSSDKGTNLYSVHFMTPYATWENVEAKDEDDAIRQCPVPSEFDMNEPHTWLAFLDE